MIEHGVVAGLRTKLNKSFADVQGEIKLLRWMLTFLTGLVLLVFGKQFGVVG